MVCFVILHYLASNETIVCVNSILNNVVGNKKIIIVDNCSPNDSLKILKKTYSNNNNVVILETNTNMGFAKGNNYGYEYAARLFKPDFIVVMNNDMEIKQQNFISEIERCFQKYHFDIMGPDIYSTKKKYHQNPQTRKLPSYKDLKKTCFKLSLKLKFKFLLRLKWLIINNLKKENNNEFKPEQNHKVDHLVTGCMLHGSCYIFSRKYIEKHPIECFYNKTFMYLEAEILYYLSKKNNELIVYCPTLFVEHHEDVSTDLQYKKQYDKSIFSIKCLLQSSRAFMKLMETYGDV